MIDSFMWVERYRPRTLAETALSAENSALLNSFLTRGEIPHLLLVGPPGTGKTAVAKVLMDNLDCTRLVLNASSERGIDVVRDTIGTFARMLTPTRLNVVFLDEFDKMTADAQTALRNLMETYAERTRFILTGNYLHKVIEPIVSRCGKPIELSIVPVRERLKVLMRINEAEGMGATVPVLSSYASAFSDMRRMIGTVQQQFMSKGSLEPYRTEASGGGTALAMVSAKDWNGLLGLARTPGFDPLETLRGMFWSVEGEGAAQANLRFKIGRAVHEAGFTVDPVVHFLGCVAELLQ